MVDFEVEQFLAQIRTINERFYGSERALATFSAVLQNSATAARTGRSAQDAFNTVLREGRKTVQENAAAYKNGSKSYVDAVQAIKDWRNEAMAAAGANENYRQKLDKIGSQMEAELGLRRVLNDNLNSASAVAIRNTLGNLGESAAGLVRSYQGGASDLTLANSAMQQAVQFGAKTAGIFGETIQGAGASLSMMGGPRTRMLGLGLEVAGSGLKMAGDAAGKLAATVLPILGDELSKYNATFQSLSGAGAMFADGLTGMVQSSGDLNLLLPEFAEVLRENSIAVAESGQGLTSTLKQMGDIGKIMKDQGINKNLLNLGFSYKEQASLVAETMASMRQSGEILGPAQNEEIARQTEKYAENLRTISAITGEDAKKRIDEVKQQSNRLAFQQKLNQLEPTQRQEAIQALAAMSKEQQQAVMETIVMGRTTTPALAYLVENLDGFGESVNTFTDQFSQGTLSTQGVIDENARVSDRMKASMMDNESLARAGFAGVGGIVGELEGMMSRQLAYMNKVTDDSAKSTEENLKKQKEAQDALTQSMTTATEAGRGLATTIQKEILESGVINKYAEVIGYSTTKIKEAIDAFAKSTYGRPDDNGSPGGIMGSGDWWEKTKLAMQGGVEGALIGAVFTKSPFGMLAGAVAGLVNKLFPNGLDMTKTQGGGSTVPYFPNLGRDSAPSREGQAQGGILRGSPYGFGALLHGTEAVIPLPEGMREGQFATILQSFNDNFSDDSLNPQQNNSVAGIVSDLQRTMGDGNEQVRTSREQNELLEAMNNKLQELIDATQNVAKFTRDTSMRIA